MTDEDLRSAVADELVWDPKMDSAAVAVSAKDGVITLRGTVGSFAEKRDARWDAERVYGVIDVNDELEVELLSEDIREDADLRGAVLQALMLNCLIPSATIDAWVDDGWVTLSGRASWQFQRDEAEHVTGRILGVRGVFNDVALVAAGPGADGLEEAITKAMERNARLDASNVSVESSAGTVMLIGTVSSWADHDEALRAAWAAPGVATVVDQLRVAYRPR